MEFPSDIKEDIKDIKDQTKITIHQQKKVGHLIKMNLLDYVINYLQDSKNSTNPKRKKRQADLNIPVPTSPSFYEGKINF